MARLRGFEPPTSGSGDEHQILLRDGQAGALLDESLLQQSRQSVRQHQVSGLLLSARFLAGWSVSPLKRIPLGHIETGGCLPVSLAVGAVIQPGFFVGPDSNGRRGIHRLCLWLW